MLVFHFNNIKEYIFWFKRWLESQPPWGGGGGREEGNSVNKLHASVPLCFGSDLDYPSQLKRTN